MAEMEALSFEIIGDTKNAVDSISNLKRALSGLSKISVGNVANSMKGAAGAISEFAQAIDKIDLNKCKAFSSALKGFGSVSTFMHDVDQFAQAPQRLMAGFELLHDYLEDFGNIDLSNLESAAGSIGKITKAISKMNEVGLKQAKTEAEEWADKMNSIIESQDKGAWGNMHDVFDMSGVDSVIGFFKNAIGGAKTAIQETGDTAADAAPKVAALKNEVAGLTRVSKSNGNTGIGILKSILGRMTSPVTNLVDKFKTLGSSLARIAMYRALRSVIKQVTDAFKQGTTNLYNWSKAVGGATVKGKTFAETMNGLSSASAYLKNSIGAAVAPFISALAPAIDFAIGKIVALINVINQLLALLGGGMGWNKATYQAKEFGKAAAGGGGAAKEALKYLAPFDELNVLPDENQGGGGGGAADAYEGMFEHMEEFSEKIANFAQMVKDAWASGDWQDVGQFIGGKINEAINNIPWGDLGETLGKGLNALIGMEYWTIKTVDFKNLGSKIAEFFNNAIENINWDIAGRLPVRALTSIIDTIIGFIQTLHWDEVGTAVKEYFVGAIREIDRWISETDFVQLGKDIVNAMVTFFRNLDINTISNAIYNTVIAAVGAAGGLLVGALDSLMAEIFGDTAWSAIKMAFDIDFSDADKKIKKWVKDNQVELPVNGKLKGVDKGELRAEEKMLDGFTANIDNVDLKDKKKKFTLDGIISVGDVIFGGDFGAIQNGMYLMKTIAEIVTTKLGLKGDKVGKDGNPVIDSTANMTKRTESGKFSTIFSSIADFFTRSESGGFSTIFKSTADFNTKTTSGGFSTVFKSIADFVDKRTNFSTIFSSIANFTSWTPGFKSTPIIPVIAKIKTVIGRIFGGTTDEATGGVYANGRWNDITHYASGGYPKGSQLFWAREAGPELVGTLGGHTAVMNNDQIVASVSAGVARAISGISFQMSGMPVMAYNTTEPDENNEDAMYRAFSRALSEADLDHDIILDGYTIYNAMVRRNRLEQSRTGVNPMTA